MSATKRIFSFFGGKEKAGDFHGQECMLRFPSLLATSPPTNRFYEVDSLEVDDYRLRPSVVILTNDDRLLSDHIPE